MVSVVPEHFGAPLHYQLPGAEGDATLPRQLQVELRLLVILVVEHCKRDGAEESKHVLSVPQLLSIAIPWIPETFQHRPAIGYGQGVRVRNGDGFREFAF